ncbi:MAG: hypothetical protein GY862_21855, partial [Gammaproteobacteria bacterium]|nr:hypothetical protein [Gammaproteobacteria bacterium]
LTDPILEAGGEISGGRAGGRISGNAEIRPLLENILIQADTQLVHVLIGENVTFEDVDKAVMEDVRFVSNDAIPAGIDLSGNFGVFQLLESSSRMQQLHVLDLSADVVLNAEAGVLTQINTLPGLNGLQLHQNPASGMLELNADGVHAAVLPFRVKQAAQGSMPGLSLFPDERVRFVTAAGREIVVQPALQNSKALLALLPDAFTLEIESNGNISIAS